MPIIVEENDANQNRLRELLSSVPPTGKVTLVGAALLICAPSYVLKVMHELNIDAPHVVEDLANRSSDTGVQFFSMQYRAANASPTEKVSSWLLSRSASEDALAAMLNCRYGNILLGLNMKDYQIDVDMPSSDQCDIEKTTEFVTQFNTHVRDMIISRYSQKLAADTNTDARVSDAHASDAHTDVLCKNIIGPADSIAAHCCRVWESPIGIYLCTKQGILVVPNEHPHAAALHAGTAALAPELSVDNWLSIVLAPQGVRFHLGAAGANVELRKDIEAKIAKDNLSANTARDLADSIEADFDLANLACAWAAAWKTEPPTRLYPSCVIEDYVKDAMRLHGGIAPKNRMCILTPNGQKNCLFHNRQCRKVQRLDPIALDYHTRQRAMAIDY